MEYDTLASKLKDVLEADGSAFSAVNLVKMDSVLCANCYPRTIALSLISLPAKATLERWFAGYKIPLIHERVNRLRELGQGLIDGFDGESLNVVKQAQGSAARLVQIILNNFPGDLYFH